MEVVTSFAAKLMAYLWSVSWQVSILIGIIAVIERLYTRSSPLFRYLLWSLVLVRLCVPLNVIISPVARLFSLQFGNIANKTVQLYSVPFNTITDVSYNILVKEQAGLSLSQIFLYILAVSYVCGIVAYGIIILVGILKTQKLVRLCTPVTKPEINELFTRLNREIGIQQPVELLSVDADSTRMPAYIGIFHPRIILSRTIIETWPLKEVEPILLHELYHVKRFDSAVNWLQIIVQAVFFFNPFVWYANKRLRTIREELCDDHVVRHLGSGFARYARSMLRIVEETSQTNRPGFVLVQLTGHENRIKERIGRIMKTDYRKYKTLSAPAMLVFAALIVFSLVIACGESNTLTSEQSVLSKETDGQSESYGIVLKYIDENEYEICGEPATKENLAQVYREQLTKKISYFGTIPPTKEMLKKGVENTEDYKNFCKTIQQVHSEIVQDYETDRNSINRNNDSGITSQNPKLNSTTEANFILQYIIKSEKTYNQMEKTYADFDFGENCQSIGFAQPEGAKFEYAFKGDTAYARELLDANGDGDTDDVITLSVGNVEGLSVPGNSTESKEKQSKSIHVTILGNGNYKVNGVDTSSSELEYALQKEIAKNNEVSVILDGSDEATYKDIDYVTDIAVKNSANGVAYTGEFSEKLKNNGSGKVTFSGKSIFMMQEPETVKILILENGDYEIDGKQIPRSELGNAIMGLKDKLTDKETILQIGQKREVGEDVTPGREYLIKTLQKVGIDIMGK